jgi:hypothetical protein
MEAGETVNSQVNLALNYHLYYLSGFAFTAIGLLLSVKATLLIIPGDSGTISK